MVLTYPVDVLPAPTPGMTGCGAAENNLTAVGAWRVLWICNCLFRVTAARRRASKLQDIFNQWRIERKTDKNNKHQRSLSTRRRQEAIKERVRVAREAEHWLTRCRHPWAVLMFVHEYDIYLCDRTSRSSDVSGVNAPPHSFRYDTTIPVGTIPVTIPPPSDEDIYLLLHRKVKLRHTHMPLVKLFARNTLTKTVPLARLQTKLCEICECHLLLPVRRVGVLSLDESFHSFIHCTHTHHSLATQSLVM